MATGWATIQVKEIRIDTETADYEIIHKWADISPNYNSVPWCECRAVLKALEVAPPNCNIHIHTDCKGTLDKVQSMKYGTYRKNQHKCSSGNVLIQGILDKIREHNGVVIIEWVKAHENIKPEYGWIKNLKTFGNNLVENCHKSSALQGSIFPEPFGFL